ncbi:MAG: septum formation initiator family protein [Endozoicomonas sp.]
MRKLVMSVLTLMFIFLQIRLWTGEGSVAEIIASREQIEKQQKENERLYRRNQLLAAEVVELQNGLETLEEQARLDLGMIRSDETLYLIYD